MQKFCLARHSILKKIDTDVIQTPLVLTMHGISLLYYPQTSIFSKGPPLYHKMLIKLDMHGLQCSLYLIHFVIA